MKTTLLTLVAFVALMALAGCGAVTETGNPVYENETFGVRVEYPSGWEEAGTSDVGPGDIQPDQSGEVACFEIAALGTNACLHMSFLSPAPASLIAYLEETYPTRDFVVYNTSTLTGYMYDDPSDGINGGDQREYYFLDGDVLVRVVAELFPGGEDQLAAFLNSISFQ